MKNLRVRFNKVQIVKRVPLDLVPKLGKSWLVKSLGTSDVRLARKLRDRVLADWALLFERLRNGAHDEVDLDALAALEAMDPLDRDAVESALSIMAEERGDKDGGVGWYKRQIGEVIPIMGVLDRFCSECPVAETTDKARRVSIKRFCEWLPDPVLQKVNRRVAGEYVAHLVATGAAPKTVNSHVSFLNVYFKWCVKRGLIPSNPFQGQQLSAEVRVKRLHWERPEILHLIDNAPTRLLKHAIAVAALSGMRAGELASLRVQDCEGGIFRVKEHEKGKTKAATRRVPIHSELALIVVDRTKGKLPEQLLFPELGGRSKELVKKFARFRAKVFGKVEGQAQKTFHSLRHSFVTFALQAGNDLYVVQSCVGHVMQGGVTTSVYHHGPSIDQLRKVVESVRLNEGAARTYASPGTPSP